MLTRGSRSMCVDHLFKSFHLHLHSHSTLNFRLRILYYSILWDRTQQCVRTSRHGLLLCHPILIYIIILLYSRQMRSWEHRPAVEISGMLGSLTLTAAFDALSHLLNFSWVQTLMILLEFSKVKSQTCRNMINDIISSVHCAFTNIFQAVLISFRLLAISTLLSALVFHHARFWKLYVLLEIVSTFVVLLCSVALTLG